MIRDFDERAVTPEILYWEIEHQAVNPRTHHKTITVEPDEESMGWASLMLDMSDQDERLVVTYPSDYYMKDVKDREELIQTGVIDGNSN